MRNLKFKSRKFSIVEARLPSAAIAKTKNDELFPFISPLLQKWFIKKCAEIMNKDTKESCYQNHSGQFYRFHFQIDKQQIDERKWLC